MVTRERIEPLPTPAGDDEPCPECSAGYRRLMILTAATTFAASIALIVLAATAWLAWEARCG